MLSADLSAIEGDAGQASSSRGGRDGDEDEDGIAAVQPLSEAKLRAYYYLRSLQLRNAKRRILMCLNVKRSLQRCLAQRRSRVEGEADLRAVASVYDEHFLTPDGVPVVADLHGPPTPPFSRRAHVRICARSPRRALLVLGPKVCPFQ